MGFNEFKKQFDLSSFQFVQTDDSVNKNSERVYSMRQLNIAIDSLEKENKKIRQQLDHEVKNSALKFAMFIDTTAGKKLPKDSLLEAAKNFNDLIPDSAGTDVHLGAISQINALNSNLANRELIMKEKEKNLAQA